jgi:DNA-binding Xre family transcriptional regulator
MRMRIRFPELLKQHGKTAYAVHKDSGGRISLSTAYRLKKSRGNLKFLDVDLLEALCDVFEAEPGDILERERKSRRKK